MSFLKSWAPHVQTGVRPTGRDDQMSGRVVQLDPVDGELVRAEVRGSKTHMVTVRRAQSSCVAQCDCPSFAGGFYCRHIWATLLDVHMNGARSEDPGIEAALASPVAPKARKRTAERRPPRGEPDWIGRLALLRLTGASADGMTLARRQICFIVNAERSSQHNGLVVNLWHRIPTQTGWSAFRPSKIDEDAFARLDDPADVKICAMMLGAKRLRPDEIDREPAAQRAHGIFHLRAGAERNLLRAMVKTGRCFVDDGAGTTTALTWDGDADTPAWVLWMTGTKTDKGLSVDLELRRGDDRMGIHEPLVLVGGRNGLLIHDSKVVSFDDRDATRWVMQFRDESLRHRETSSIQVPSSDIERFLDRLYLLPELPEIDLPEALRQPQRHLEPTPCIELLTSTDAAGTRHQLLARIWFDYDGHRVRPLQASRFVVKTGPSDDKNDAVLIRRNDLFERESLAHLAPLGFRSNPSDEAQSMLLAARDMPAAVEALMQRGWRVLANHRAVHSARPPSLAVSTGIDWFELRGEFCFETEHGPQIIGLPQILAAANAGQQMLRLDDGSEGLLPTDWLRRHGLLSALGTVEGDHLRFRRSQAAVLDAMLEERELVEIDPPFEQARARLHQFERIEPIHEANTFTGTLRSYQRDGLGWLAFLRWFAMGGILADDMGLGKTIQVLALLDRRHNPSCQGENDPPEPPEPPEPPPKKPTLIVVPRSVIFNWMDEAARFAPRLRVQAYTGADRETLRDTFGEHNVIVTSYGLMRRDIAELCKHEFDYVVLDEAQAIKNPASQSAKAARLLRADHRLALSGTPIENHLGDLWSIFEFLNPGMLGTEGRFGNLVRSGLADLRSKDAATQAAAALRPFILRRTKKQVLEELPEKTEQTIVCEMEPAQRTIYDRLLEHYRGTLLNQVQTPRVGKSTMMVLEALLRLRQAACHPGLIDPQYADEPSAKIETLFDHLSELIQEGHKALVFSQFTSLLALVRPRLKREGIDFEYLDGKTRDRKRCVQRFQNDPACPLFLISLKAGGLGLNLTAAEYVFILDPWWNPAVEAQAIDRAHRIGQTHHVFAYRLICADSVEQRIAELQERKKKLADAIVGGQSGLLQSLTREDLQGLLS